MLFEQRFWPGIADGSVTTTFRRWQRPQVVAGRPYRTPGGIVVVDAVDLVDAGEITDDDARRSGYPTAADLVADLRGSPDLPITRVRFHRSADPDPRAALAADDALDAAAVAAIAARLDRLDRAATDGPWTLATLGLIAEHPGTRAGDLAAAAGRDMAPFKLDVRKLKALGLTESLTVGYRLSPRGEAFLRAGRDGLRVGIAHHFGWAVAVTATADGRVVDRRRIELVEAGTPVAPIHTDGRDLPDDELAAMVASVRASASRATAAALEHLAGDLPGPVASLSLRAWDPAFPTDLAVQRQVPHEARADSVMYRQVLVEAAQARGWAVCVFDAKDVERRALAVPGIGPDVLDAPRRELGAPWTKDHRLALAAAIVAAAAAVG